jgi:hypothetical protein
MATKFSNWPQNIATVHKIYQMATKYTKWQQNISSGHKIHLPMQVPPIFTQILIFYHLATLSYSAFNNILFILVGCATGQPFEPLLVNDQPNI